MIVKRVNTDLFVTLSVLEDNKEADLSTASNIKAYVQHALSGVDSEQTYTISGNKVSFQWSSKENTRCGYYNARVEYDRTDGDSETGYVHYIVDYPEVFQVVHSSEQEDGENVMQLSGNAYAFSPSVPRYIMLK